MNPARRLVACLAGILVLLCASTALAWFTTPTFTDHAIPNVETPSPDASWWEYVDVAVLIASLSAASYFVLVSRWRRGLFWLTLFSLAYFGFFRYGCVCPIGAIQNVSLSVCDKKYAIPATVVAFFTLPLVFTLFFGRTFCAAVCPLGAVQEVITIRSVRVPAWLDHALRLVPYFYLGAAVAFAGTGTAFIICRYDPFVVFFRLGGAVNMLVFGGCMLVIGLFVGRPYCRYLCPYGGILALLSKVSWRHAKITPEKCIQCRLCEDACPYGAIRQPTVDQPYENRRRGRRRLGIVLAAVPVLIGGFAALVGCWASRWRGCNRTSTLPKRCNGRRRSKNSSTPRRATSGHPPTNSSFRKCSNTRARPTPRRTSAAKTAALPSSTPRPSRGKNGFAGSASGSARGSGW